MADGFIWVEFVHFDMNSTIRERVDPYANANGWSWTRRGRLIYEKDGYEVYVFSKNDGFELTIKNPETMERETIIEVRNDDIDTSSPLYVAILEYVLENAETIVANI